ncbi:MAG: DUF2807 domain-containing protein [Polyangiales bacterium]
MRMLLVCLVLAACSSASAGPSVTETRKLDAFTGLDVSAVLDVKVAIGSPAKVEVRGPQEWLARLTTKVEKGVLVAAMPGQFNNVPKLEMLITMPALTSIDLSGVVTLTASKLSGKSLVVDVSGVGSVVLSGAVEALRVEMSGAASIDAEKLTTSTTALELSGAGDAIVRATRQLDVSLSGAGNVTAYGKPATIHKSISGVGELDLR